MLMGGQQSQQHFLVSRVASSIQSKTGRRAALINIDLSRVGLGTIFISRCHCDMRLYSILDFGYIVISWCDEVLSFPCFNGCITVQVTVKYIYGLETELHRSSSSASDRNVREDFRGWIFSFVTFPQCQNVCTLFHLPDSHANGWI